MENISHNLSPLTLGAYEKVHEMEKRMLWLNIDFKDEKWIAEGTDADGVLRIEASNISFSTDARDLLASQFQRDLVEEADICGRPPRLG